MGFSMSDSHVGVVSFEPEAATMEQTNLEFQSQLLITDNSLVKSP